MAEEQRLWLASRGGSVDTREVRGMTIKIPEVVGTADRRSYDCGHCDLVLSMAHPLWVRLQGLQRRFCLDCVRAGSNCPRCRGPRVVTPLSLVGQPCPRCHQGLISRTGLKATERRRLPEGWNTREVPQVVSDLMGVRSGGAIPSTLQSVRVRETLPFDREWAFRDLALALSLLPLDGAPL